MVRVGVWCVVQNHRLGEIPPKDAEIFDVVAEDAGTIVLIQTMPTREDVFKKKKTYTPVALNHVSQYVLWKLLVCSSNTSKHFLLCKIYCLNQVEKLISVVFTIEHEL